MVKLEQLRTQQTMRKEQYTDSNKPEAKFSAGAVSATIWSNASDHGSFSTISLVRTYKDKDGQWKTTTTMRINDLPKAHLVLTKAYDYLLTHGKERASA